MVGCAWRGVRESPAIARRVPRRRLRVGLTACPVPQRTAGIGASSSLPPIPAKAASPNRQRTLRLGGGNWSYISAPTRPVPCAARKGRFGVRNGRPSVRADRSRLRWLKLKHPQRVLAVAVAIGVRIAAHATTSGFLPSYREADRLRPFNNAARGSIAASVRTHLMPTRTPLTLRCAPTASATRRCPKNKPAEPWPVSSAENYRRI